MTGDVGAARYRGRLEAARYIGVSARNLDQLAADGKLTPCRPSREARVLRRA